ncbi:hypothetical protein ECC02_011434 [Trypanosoma cruzi]|uniref:Uncharacterized protein n=1 Tax=Trypanosoma cruzi TaxID=5693 RepID=A0A7J6XPT8_TRYCR|nr:hypothetical protein ECC02_011434 [Trypanosoma cruzi]
MESNRGDERCGRHTQRAHHMRRGQQPGMHRTPHTTHDTHSNPRQQAHTHTQPCRNTNTQMEEGEANRSGTQGSTACTYGESGPSCRHPSRRVRTHTRGGAAPTATQKQSNNGKKEIPAHHVDCWSTESAANIHHKIIQLPLAFVHIQRTPLHAGTAIAAAAAQPKKYGRKEWNKASNHLFVFLFNVGRCLHMFFFFALRRANLHAWVVCWGLLQGTQSLCFFLP